MDIANAAAAAVQSGGSGSDDTCPTCGRSDNIPEPNPKAAADIQKGATTPGTDNIKNWSKNLKEAFSN